MPERFSDKALLALAGKIGQYMGQVPWKAAEHANGACITDPARADFGFHVRNTWPWGRVALDGLTVRHLDKPYDQSWHYHDMQITVDADRPPDKLAGDVKRRLLPAMEPRYLEICKEREEFKATIIQCRDSLAWINGLRKTFDPDLDPWEESAMPAHGSHEKWLQAGTREFRLEFYGGKLDNVKVSADREFVDGMIGLHLSTLPPLWGYWRKWDIEDNAPARWRGHRRDECGELRGDWEENLAFYYKAFIENYERFYKLQYRQLGNEQWQDWQPVVEPSSVA